MEDALFNEAGDVLRSLLLEAWRMTAPKRLAASLEPTDRGV